ncbi:hypothetical protein GGTG_03315 [Gaeumannomyces tritici R3-111a-1]|uniref:Uncharacterized protein n=1 Tax=Gaeumannomyces tritici (strain R3-111a-1) TaxID=644352 RepID=J3NPV8_GAET3|nr:hypothetical protein GGTG_03315 [Gaeumannomyces tritici R3-111a-1]EJT78213.1 hypothetical protein GGTG_03315 [Gaeumannomyces tritici R3-111a-1]
MRPCDLSYMPNCYGLSDAGKAFDLHTESAEYDGVTKEAIAKGRPFVLRTGGWIAVARRLVSEGAVRALILKTGVQAD